MQIMNAAENEVDNSNCIVYNQEKIAKEVVYVNCGSNGEHG